VPWVNVAEPDPVRLAVNVCDLTRIDPTVREILLEHGGRTMGKLDVAAGVIRTDPERLDESAVAFACDLLTAACCLDVMRDHDRRVGDPPTRCYLKTAFAWNKLPAHAVLTLITDGKPALNPKWFRHVAAPAVVRGSGPRRAF